MDGPKDIKLLIISIKDNLSKIVFKDRGISKKSIKIT